MVLRVFDVRDVELFTEYIYLKFGDGLKELRKQSKSELVSLIYNCANKNVPLATVFKSLKIA